MARIKNVKRPKVTQRKAALDPGSTIIEVTAADGTGLLIEVRANRNGKGLRVYPYRADADVALHVSERGSHADDCRVYRDSSNEARCDCGAELVPQKNSAGVAIGWTRTDVLRDVGRTCSCGQNPHLADCPGEAP